MRILFSVLVLAGGLVLGFVSYFLLAAPLGVPTNEGFSDPNVPFAATFFVAAIVLVFLSLMLYELFPERRRE